MDTDAQVFPHENIVTVMQGFIAPWFICGGWAIDLFLGRTTRPHEDVEIAIFRQDQLSLRSHLKGWQTEKVQPRDGLRPWNEDEWLSYPIHEIHTKRNADEMRLEFLLNERDYAHWIYRRDQRITLPIEEASFICNSKIPVLSPQIVLLFKSKRQRAKDEADFSAILPELSLSSRRWLRDALQITEPEHPWAGRIDA